MNTTFKFKCHYCGKSGHKKKNCIKWKREQSDQKSKSSKIAVRFIASGDNYGNAAACPIEWNVDCGASDHMHLLTNPVIIGVAKNGVFLEAKNFGVVRGVVKIKNQILQI